MKFYRINYFVSDSSEQATEWTTNARKAEKIARDNACGHYSAVVIPVEVPTDKKGLTEFLNDNIWTHPGAASPYGG